MNSAPIKDSRSKGGPRSSLALENQSMIYELLKGGDKLSITDIHMATTLLLNEKGERPLHEKTIRRSIEALAKSGHIKAMGRGPTGAVLYGRVDVGFANDTQPEETPLLNLAGNLVSVEDFFKTFADPEIDPFRLKATESLLRDDISQGLRRSLLYVAISSGQTGQDESLKKTAARLQKALDELNYVTSILKNFLESPIWYEHYRDRVGLGVRGTQKKDPELFKLAIDCVKGD